MTIESADPRMTLVPCTEDMGCGPRSFPVFMYGLPETFGRMEYEEAAARVLVACNNANAWMGIPLPRYVATMKEELEAFQTAEQRCKAEREAADRFYQALRRWWWFVVLTLGIYAIFVAQPVAQTSETPEYRAPLTSLYMFGPDKVLGGLAWILAQGYLRTERRGEGDNCFDVIFPTRKMVEFVAPKMRALADERGG